MDWLIDGDGIDNTVACYQELIATAYRAYDPRKILLLTDYFKIPMPATSEQARIKSAIAIVGEHVASHFDECERAELNRRLKNSLCELAIRLECEDSDAADVTASASDHRLYYLSGVDCGAFLLSLETLLTHESNPKFQPIEVYLFGPFATPSAAPRSRC